ncbi:MAG: NAD(P)-dependent oxidoreductase, partial [Myxococcota bacterium]|nr:NAD(P)-dependent oxidoreductase [Myxococcota bacterium]
NIECRNGVWGKNNHQRYEVLGKNLCVLGLGNIGRSVARAAQSLGMNILFYDTRQVSVELGKELGWTHIESLERLFKQADFLTVHLSAKDIKGITNKGVLIPDLFTLLGQDRFNSPKVFINFSRGFLHEPEALIQAVHDGHIHRAAVDVYPKEPRRGEQWENPYVNCDRIVVFPHIGASTQ